LANLTGTERSRYVQGMFARIARRYDLMNRTMTVGQDVRWRREVIRRAALPPAGRLLDLGAGTGDLAREALRQSPTVRALAADFTLEMMQVGRSRWEKQPGEDQRLDWSAADAQALPLPDDAFDAVVSGYLLRNVSDLDLSLSEQRRVLKPGGRVVCLDTTPPPRNRLRPLIAFHLHTVIPALGRALSGQRDAYTYLPQSVNEFLTPDELKLIMERAGLREVKYQRLMLSTVAIHVGIK
jgi:demethylmenaquinone methyltransferase/2-methoxy-6-polyprenyl-1,4-benzoquinol methylase